MAWPWAGRAQQAEQTRRIGVLLPAPEGDQLYLGRLTTLREALGKLGWVESRNLHIEYRWSRVDATLFRTHAAELVNLSPEVIVTTSTPTVRALQQATATIPVVFVTVSDPVGDGFVASLAKPGGNITGFSNYDPAVAGKWMEIVRELSPGVRRVALLFNPTTAPYPLFVGTLRDAGRSSNLDVVESHVHSVPDTERAIAACASEPRASVIAIPDTFTVVNRTALIEAAARHHVPVVYPFASFPRSGGLISYGVETADQYRAAASYVDRIIKGARPAELPVQQPTKFELVINSKTAKVLGLTIPPTLLARADEVIE